MVTDKVHHLVKLYQNLTNIFSAVGNFLLKMCTKKRKTAEKKLI